MQLTTNQWKIVTLCAVGGLFEMMDMYVIGFILAGLTKPWHLNYGQSATVLLASGIGAVLGSLVWGQFSDIFGRKIAFIGTLFVCSAASLALALTPDGNWIYLAALRAVLGSLPSARITALVDEPRGQGRCVPLADLGAWGSSGHRRDYRRSPDNRLAPLEGAARLSQQPHEWNAD